VRTTRACCRRNRARKKPKISEGGALAWKGGGVEKTIKEKLGGEGGKSPDLEERG